MSPPAWIQPFADGAIDPARVARSLAQLAEIWPADLVPLRELILGLPDAGDALAHLLSVSPVSAEKLFADPSALVWLADLEICQNARDLRRMRGAYERLRSAYDVGFDTRYEALRRWKQREMLRIALREVVGWASVEQTTRELTFVAELCLRTVVDGWSAELARRWGQPGTEFAVLGMGKFGGQELNYSSDIDVIFFYGEDGQLNPRFTHQEFFTRLAEKVIATFSASDPAGALFRIDVRLRPEGASGLLVRSLESMEHYYAGFGETWERLALIKARLVAGSAELGYQFTQRLQPFIFPRAVSLDVVEEISAIKGRIEREIVGEACLRRNVKLGYGGIREIEFVVQTLQLLHGARHAFLQERGTLTTLQALRQLDLLPHAEMETLIAAYRFLRTVEHRLQMENEAQTHTLPVDPEALERLARSLGLERVAALQAELTRHTDAVREIFNRILRPTEEAPEPKLDLSFFANPEHARRAFADLDGSSASSRFSPRTRKLALKLEPLLLTWLRRIADPDTTLTRIVRFIERYGARGLLLETLLQNPRLLELLVRLFDASSFMSEIVLRRPQLIEEVARAGGLGEALTVSDYLAGLARNEEGLAWLDRVRAYRRAQVLRIGLRDVLSFATLPALQAEYSALAEACFVYTQQELGLAEELTVVALGKFGGRELSYGADLDVIFLGENAKAAAELTRAMSQVTTEGSVFRIDARLRPEGEAGPLVCTLASYEAYFEKRAQLWEAQSLTKARPINGPQRREYLAAAQRIWRHFGACADLLPQVGAMHARIVRERSSGDEFLDFKTGPGGLIQLEFFVQAQQMKAGLWEPNTLIALGMLAEQGRLDEASSARLREAYLFLRKVEAVLRIDEEKSVSVLPREEAAQTRLARRCQTANWSEFAAQYQSICDEVQRLACLS